MSSFLFPCHSVSSFLFVAENVARQRQNARYDFEKDRGKYKSDELALKDHFFFFFCLFFFFFLFREQEECVC